MAMIPEETIKAVIDATDIVDVIGPISLSSVQAHPLPVIAHSITRKLRPSTLIQQNNTFTVLAAESLEMLFHSSKNTKIFLSRKQ